MDPLRSQLVLEDGKDTVAPPGQGKSKHNVIEAGMYQRRLAPMWKDTGHWKINLAQGDELG